MAAELGFIMGSNRAKDQVMPGCAQEVAGASDGADADLVCAVGD